MYSLSLPLFLHFRQHISRLLCFHALPSLFFLSFNISRTSDISWRVWSYSDSLVTPSSDVTFCCFSARFVMRASPSLPTGSSTSPFTLSTLWSICLSDSATEIETEKKTWPYVSVEQLISNLVYDILTQSQLKSSSKYSLCSDKKKKKHKLLALM